MEDAIEAIRSRRSIRAYEEREVPKDLIEKVIEAGLWAPSGMGRQSAIVVAVTDKEKISWLSELNRKIGGWKPGFDPFYGA
ncbi:MAG: diguanylate cyclase, partial [Coriobacteriaceae bacterium]